MRIARFSLSGRAKYGVVDSGVIYGLRGIPFATYRPDGKGLRFDGSAHPLGEVRLLAPTCPSKIVAIGLNYRAHAEETKMQAPATPLIFLKPSTAVIGPDGRIVLPRAFQRVDYEGELAVVIGRKAKNVRKDSAGDYVLGYTCANDVSERQMQKADGQWSRAKGFDTFAPLGPWIETDLDAGNVWLTTSLNGEIKQSASTSGLIFGVPELLEFISGVMTLLPGDVIITGTPAGIGPMRPSDVVEVTIEGIGTLRNYVAAQE